MCIHTQRQEEREERQGERERFIHIIKHMATDLFQFPLLTIFSTIFPLLHWLCSFVKNQSYFYGIFFFFPGIYMLILTFSPMSQAIVNLGGSIAA